MTKFCVAVCAALLTAACQDSPTWADVPIGRLSMAGTASFVAEGAPSVDESGLLAGTFATAVADSTGTTFILAFKHKEGTRGDYFVIWLNGQRTGAFTPCRPTQADADGFALAPTCNGFLHNDYEISELVQSGARQFQMIDGSIDVGTLGDRLVGTVEALRLVQTNGQSITFASGSFDLPLLRGNQARLLHCFTSDAAGVPCRF
jgi:hypothetical protein